VDGERDGRDYAVVDVVVRIVVGVIVVILSIQLNGITIACITGKDGIVM